MSSPVDQPLPIRPLSSVPALSPAEPGLAVAQPLARALAAGLAVWAAGWAALLLLDGHIDLANQALLLVLAAAVAALWLPALAAVLVGTVSVLAFNWLFVPPRGTLAVDGRQNGLLLLAMLVLNTVVAGLMARLRHQASHARQHQQQAEQLRSLGDALRDSAEPLAHAGTLQAALASLLRAPVALLLCRDQPDAVSPALTNTGAIGGHPADTEDTNPSVMVLGQPDADETAGLWHCLRQGRAMGPGSGHHEALAHWYLPLRGRQASYGAAVLRLPAPGRVDEALRSHAQALCDQMGLALQRQASHRAEQRALAQAQLQAVRNALLAAISHDYRTPLATILGAASSLQDQGERMDSTQRQRLAQRIVQETGHLARLTDNTLQLARLDAPGVQLQLDWESAEELVGTVLRRARQHAPGRLLRARLEPGLPLLRCDALLLTQLLDNLVDNALGHTPPDTPIEILVRRSPTALVLAVRDRGPGVAPAWRERIFEVFQRGAIHNAATSTAPNPALMATAETGTNADLPGRRGAGVGLAVCRAIARAHGGELRVRARSSGGSSFECHLPLPDAAPNAANAPTEPTP